MFANTIQPWKNKNVCAGIGVLISSEITIVYRALIIPHSCCIDPPKIKEITKFPELMKFITPPPVSVADAISSASA
jgi:hypothetical protein